MTPDAPERAPTAGPTTSDPKATRPAKSDAPDPRLAAREARRAALDLLRHLWVLLAAGGRGVARLGGAASARSGALLARRRDRARTEAPPRGPADRPAAEAGTRWGGPVRRRPVLLAAGAAILLPALA